jgi:predicted secreted protein
MMKMSVPGFTPRLIISFLAAVALPGALLLNLSSQANADSPQSPPAVVSTFTTSPPSPSPTGDYEQITLGTAGMRGIVFQENAGSTGYSWQFSVEWSRLLPTRSVSGSTPPRPSPTSTGSWENDVVLLDSTTLIRNPIPMPGSSSLRVLALTGAQRGMAWVKAELKRPWESTPIETRNFLVFVR